MLSWVEHEKWHITSEPADEVLYSKICVYNGHSNIDKTKNLMTNGSLMKVQSIAEGSLWSILQYF